MGECMKTAKKKKDPDSTYWRQRLGGGLVDLTAQIISTAVLMLFLMQLPLTFHI